MEIDHIFICTDFKAPEGDCLVEFGLKEGSTNTHPGQGTANRRFYFHNFMLELLWIENMEEVQNQSTTPMKLFERCSPTKKTTSPFGIAFRPTTEIVETAPFEAWDYHPIYLPDFLKIQVANNTPLSEPMYFYLFFAKRQDQVPVGKREPMEHKALLKEVTSVTVHINEDSALSDAACFLNQHQNLSIIHGKEHLLELEFDHGESKQFKDFRPDLPMVFKW